MSCRQCSSPNRRCTCDSLCCAGGMLQDEAAARISLAWFLELCLEGRHRRSVCGTVWTRLQSYGHGLCWLLSQLGSVCVLHAIHWPGMRTPWSNKPASAQGMAVGLECCLCGTSIVQSCHPAGCCVGLLLQLCLLICNRSKGAKGCWADRLKCSGYGAQLGAITKF